MLVYFVILISLQGGVSKCVRRIRTRAWFKIVAVSRVSRISFGVCVVKRWNETMPRRSDVLPSFEAYPHAVRETFCNFFVFLKLATPLQIRAR